MQELDLDIVELDRIAKLDARSPKVSYAHFNCRRIENLRNAYGHRRIEFLAGRFAGKEAFAKANGTGIGAHCNFTILRFYRSQVVNQLFISKEIRRWIHFYHAYENSSSSTSNLARINVHPSS